MDRTPRNVGHYVDLELIGRGGMGSVYRATDTRHGRTVAVKVLDEDVADAMAAQRFLREIRIAANLTHPHILPILDSGEADGRLFYVMPYVDGATLSDLITSRGRLSVSDVCRLGAELSDALAYAHARGIVHRDIKPANILIAADQPVIADFGLARALDEAAEPRLTRKQWVVGTPRYMSPEQAMGSRDVDGRSDVYALGCTLLEAWLGTHPFDGKTATELLAQKTRSLDDLRRRIGGGSRRLRQVLLRSVAPGPEQRYGTAAELAEALRGCEASRLGGTAVLAASAGVALLIAGAAAVTSARDSSPDLSMRRVAVSTFENRSGRVELEPVGAMAADWITQGLQRSGVVDVVPTTSVRSAERLVASDEARRPNRDPIRSLAEATSAGLIVSGTLFSQGDSLRLHVQLTDARRGAVVGGLEPILAPSGSPSDAIDEALSRVTSLLARHLDERVASGPGGSTRPPVYEAYLHFNAGIDAYSRTQWDEARQQFRAAHQRDPRFVQAQLFEALALSNLGRFAASDTLLQVVDAHRGELSSYDRSWLDYRKAFVRGDRPAALRAIRSAAAMAPASRASYNLAVESMEQGLLDEALQTLRVIDSAPGAMYGFISHLALSATVNHLLDRHRDELRKVLEMREAFPTEPWPRTLEIAALAGLGRDADVLRRLDDYALEPSAIGSQFNPLAVARMTADELRVHGRADAARVVLGRAIAWWNGLPAESRTSPGLQLELVEILRRSGRFDDARSVLLSLRGSRPSDVELMILEGAIAAAAGDERRASAMSDSLSRVDGAYLFGLPPYGRARVAAALGDRDAALRHLRAARAAGLPLGTRIHREPDFDSLRGDPEFVRVAVPWSASDRTGR